MNIWRERQRERDTDRETESQRQRQRQRGCVCGAVCEVLNCIDALDMKLCGDVFPVCSVHALGSERLSTRLSSRFVCTCIGLLVVLLFCFLNSVCLHCLFFSCACVCVGSCFIVECFV